MQLCSAGSRGASARGLIERIRCDSAFADNGGNAFALSNVLSLAMFEGDHSLNPILAARQRLDRAETRVELMRSILAGTMRGTPAYRMTLRWLNELERSRFCRALELNTLIR